MADARASGVRIAYDDLGLGRGEPALLCLPGWCSDQTAALSPSVPALPLYCLPKDPGYLAAQQAFATRHPWFQVERLAADTHFPVLEVPDAIAAAIDRFVG